MEAEKEQDNQQRSILLENSISFITQAITLFKTMKEFGPNHSEVGDCYSLLARTYLTAERITDADEATLKAHKLILQGENKEYIDLVILSGDLAGRVNKKDALEYYNDALRLLTGSHPDFSEIRARVYIKRGKSLEAMGLKSDAILDYQRAEEIYKNLQESDAEATALWEKFRVKGEFPQELQSLLMKERATVRVAAVKIFNNDLSNLSKASLSRRQKPSREYYQQLMQKARSQAAREERMC